MYQVYVVFRNYQTFWSQNSWRKILLKVVIHGSLLIMANDLKLWHCKPLIHTRFGMTLLCPWPPSVQPLLLPHIHILPSPPYIYNNPLLYHHFICIYMATVLLEVKLLSILFRAICMLYMLLLAHIDLSIFLKMYDMQS